MYCIPSGQGIKEKQPPIYHPLVLTLHEIFFGGVKKMKIHRLVFVSEDQSKTEVREKILTIPIKPGMRSGIEIVFPEEGDQNPTHIPGIRKLLYLVSRFIFASLILQLILFSLLKNDHTKHSNEKITI